MINLFNEDENLFQQTQDDTLNTENLDNPIPTTLAPKTSVELNQDFTKDIIDEPIEPVEIDYEVVDPTQWGMVKLVSPEGEAFWSAPGQVDSALERGFNFDNPNTKVPVYAPDGSSQWLEASKLTDALGRGFGYKGFQKEIVEHYSKTPELIREAIENENNLGVKAGVFLSSLGRGASFGLSDIVASVLMSDEHKEDLRLARENNQAITLAGDVLGGMVGSGALSASRAGRLLENAFTNTGMSTSGARAAGQVFRNTLEGGAYGAGYTLSEQMMGNPDITAESYLFNVGLGVGFGALLSGAVEGGKVAYQAGKVARDAKQVARTLPEVTLQTELRPQTPDIGGKASQSILNTKGEVIGTIDLTIRDPNSTHMVGREGVIINNIQLNKNAPKGTDVAAVNGLIDQYGAVFSDLTDNVPNEILTTFRNVGTEISDQQGNRFYSMFEKNLPEDAAIKDQREKIFKNFERLGREVNPEEKALFNKFRNDLEFHERVVRYSMEPDALIREGVDHVTKINEAKISIHQATEQWRQIVAENLNTSSIPAIREASESIINVAGDLERQLINNIGIYEQGASLQGLLKVVDDEIRAVVNSEILTASQRFGKLVNTRKMVSNAKNNKNTGGIVGSNKNALSDLEKALTAAERKVFESVDPTGALVNNYDKIQRASSRIIRASQEFNKNFGVKDDVVDVRRVFSQFKNSNPANRMHTSYAEMEMIGAISNMYNVLEEVAPSVKGLTVPKIDKSVISKPFITSMQEVREANQIVYNLGKQQPTTREDMLRTSAMGIGGLLPGVIASSLGMPALGAAWFLSSQAAGHFARTATKQAREPLRAFKTVMDGAGQTSLKKQSLINTIFQRSKVSDKISDRYKPMMNTSAIAKAASIVGISHTGDKEATINHIIDKLTSDVTPDGLLMLQEDLNELAPNVSTKIVDKIKEMRQFAIEELPERRESGTYDRYTRDEVRKVSNTVNLLFSPSEALETAIGTGDIELLEQLEKFYPLVIEDLKKDILSESYSMPLDKLNAKNKRIVSWATRGLNQSNDTRITQSIRDSYTALKGGEQGQPPAQTGAGRPRKFRELESQRPLSRSEQLSGR